MRIEGLDVNTRQLTRIFKLWKYPHYLKTAMFRLRAESAEVYFAEEKQRFASKGLDFDRAVQRLDQTLQVKLGRKFDYRSDSIHWLLFSALGFKYPDAKKILEIGTFDGFFTSLLTEFFPQAQITTVDLPASDPLLKAYFRRDNPDVLKSYLETQSKNLKSERIKLLSLNSLFLTEAIRGELFDLIWVDGGHVYPEVAIDLANAYAHCREGGVIVCDDVMKAPSGYNDGFVSLESNEVLKYIADRVNAEVVHFRKRCGAEYSDFFWKYVSLIERKPYSPNTH